MRDADFGSNMAAEGALDKIPQRRRPWVGDAITRFYSYCWRMWLVQWHKDEQPKGVTAWTTRGARAGIMMAVAKAVTASFCYVVVPSRVDDGSRH